MGEDFQLFEIIILVMIAAFLFFKLRTVLGRRIGHQRRPEQDPFQRRSETKSDSKNDGNVVELPDRSGIKNRPDVETEAEAVTTVADDPISAGLTQIQIADSSFNPKEFASGARAAFEMIVHAFAMGDTTTLKSLLSDDVYENFANAIRARLDAKETLETTVVGIRSADIIEAEMQGRDAHVVVKFVSEQVNVSRDTDGHVVDGDPNHIATITDIWTFSRNTRSRDPNWKLIETRSQN